MRQIADRSGIAGKLATSVLGHLNTAVRLFRRRRWANWRLYEITARRKCRQSHRRDGSRGITRYVSDRRTQCRQIGACRSAGRHPGHRQQHRQCRQRRLHAPSLGNLTPNPDQQIHARRVHRHGRQSRIRSQRQIDEALESRIRSSISDRQFRRHNAKWLCRVESLFNELTDQDLFDAVQHVFQQLVEPCQQAAGHRAAAGRHPERPNGRRRVSRICTASSQACRPTWIVSLQAQANQRQLAGSAGCGPEPADRAGRRRHRLVRRTALRDQRDAAAQTAFAAGGHQDRPAAHGRR